MTEKVIKQFKLATGDEIICEILEWDTDDNPSIVVRGSMRIISIDDLPRGIRFYSFRPWLIFQDDPSLLQTINAMHIVSEAVPNDEVLKQYIKTIAKLKSTLKKNKGMTNITEDELYGFLEKDIMLEEDVDSAADNIITFPNPKGKTFH